MTIFKIKYLPLCFPLFPWNVRKFQRSTQNSTLPNPNSRSEEWDMAKCRAFVQMLLHIFDRDPVNHGHLGTWQNGGISGRFRITIVIMSDGSDIDPNSRVKSRFDWHAHLKFQSIMMFSTLDLIFKCVEFMWEPHYNYWHREFNP